MNREPSDDIAASLSVIPYDNNREVVLRHADSIVYFDAQSRQISLRNRARSIDNRSPTRTACPTCGRGWPDQTPNAPDPQDTVGEEQPSFINHEYFRMLARSLPGSANTSPPPSPRRRIVQPERSRLSSPPIIPPPNAEFVGSSPAPLDQAHGISETAFTPQYFEKFFVTEKELGRGGRGVVLLVRHMLDGVSLGHFACKRVPVGDDHAWLERVLVEVQALQTLSHQNLVSYRHVWLQDYKLNNFGPSVPCAFILQQYCNGGDMHNYVCGPAQISTTTQDLKNRLRRQSRGDTELPRKENDLKRLHFDEIHTFFSDITAGLRFLHLNGFVHRDLKPSNCLLHTVGNETRVLVSDFGEVQYENAIRKSTGATGTISYCAPEVLRRVSPDGPLGNFTFKSDIFSLGMILHFLCFADLPYRFADVLHEEEEDLEELRGEIISWTGFDERIRSRPDLPAKLYSFLKRLLSLSPEDRPTADEVLNGIRVGGLNAIPEYKRRDSMNPEELTPGRRIQRLDTPVGGNSPHRMEREEVDGSPTGILRRRNNTHGVPHIDSSLVAGQGRRTDHESPSGSYAMQRTSSGGLQSSTLSRSSMSSPITSGHHSLSPASEQRQRLLLPPPNSERASTYLLNILRTDVTVPAVRLSVLALKLFTSLQPCLSYGINATIIYPLLALAIIEFTMSRWQLWKLMLGLILHFLFLWYTISKGILCETRRELWVTS